MANNSTNGPFNCWQVQASVGYAKEKKNGTASWLIYDNKRDTFNQMQFPVSQQL